MRRVRPARSIRRRIAFLSFAGILLPLGLGLGIIAVQDVRGLERETVESDDVVTFMVSQYSAADLAFEDREAAGRTLAGVARVDHVRFAALYDARGQLFASWARPDAAAAVPPLLPRRGTTERGEVDRFHAVVHDGVVYGTIALRVSTAPVVARTRAYLWGIAAVALGVLALSLLMSLALQRLISRPILGLAAVAEEIADQGDYSVRARAGGDDEIGTLSRAFNQMLEEIARRQRQAEEAIRLRDEFIVVAAHELKTPLTSLKLAVQLLARARAAETIGTETGARIVQSSARQTKRLERLVGNLLDVTSLTSGRFELAPREVDLGAVTRDVCDDFREDLARAGCELTVRADRPAAGRWDPLRVEQVVTNLLSNALKYGAGHPIEVTVDADSARASLSVRDHGIGIPPEDRARIFDRFERAVSVRHYGGLGLGLYISHQIVAAHGGEITVDSEAGHGATFTVVLPRGGPPTPPAHD
ncbi:MAG TPA: ATP-binding protein [Polyangia bacterium]